MNNLASQTVRDIALKIPATTRIFEELKIDYCCGGRKPLKEACRNSGVNEDYVIKKINEIEAAEVLEFDWTRASLSDLIEHIEDTHHVFTRNELGNLVPLFEKVLNAHGSRHPEIAEAMNIFLKLADDLTPHLQKEENVLFPYIRDLERRKTLNLSAPLPFFGTVQNPVRMMMMEHDTAGELLKEMRETALNYVPPPGACPSYTGLYHRLAELERDLHRHIHLENNILFPRAIELEESFVTQELL